MYIEITSNIINDNFVIIFELNLQGIEIVMVKWSSGLKGEIRSANSQRKGVAIIEMEDHQMVTSKQLRITNFVDLNATTFIFQL